MRNPFFLLALLTAACSSTHGPAPLDGGGDTCAARPPRCLASPEAYCCESGRDVDPVCTDDGWICGPGSLPPEQCAYELRGGVCIGGVSDAGTGRDYVSCGVPSDCALATATCCGTCDRPTVADYHGVRADSTDDYYLDVICPEARTEPPICPGCAVQDNPNLIPTCNAAATCDILDVENDPALSACGRDDECVLRLPQCCACGVGSNAFDTIAIRVDAEGAFGAQVCDPEAGCPDCEPTFAPGLRAACVAGTCQAVMD